MQHQIASTNVLHDEVNAGLGLETGVKVCQEGMSFPVGNQEDALLGPNTFNFVVLNDKLLLQDLDSKQPSRTLRLCKHDLSKVTLAQHRKEVEVVQTNSLASASIGSEREWLSLC